MPDQQNTAPSYSCEECHREFQYGAHKCQGCLADIVYGATQHEISDARFKGFGVWVLAAFFALMLSPVLAESLFDRDFPTAWGLGYSVGYLLIFVSAGVGAYRAGQKKEQQMAGRIRCLPTV